MKPPEHLLATMSNDSIGILTSVVLLGAALQVRRGTYSRIKNIVDPFTGKRPTAEEEAFIKAAHDKAMEEFRSATPDELDHAIALYKAHLKRNGLVNHPPHYTAHPSGIEAIAICEHFGFSVGNAIKYLWRAGLKGDAIEDLKKARWYVDREIRRREAECVAARGARRAPAVRSAARAAATGTKTRSTRGGR